MHACISDIQTHITLNTIESKWENSISSLISLVDTVSTNVHPGRTDDPVMSHNTKAEAGAIPGKTIVIQIVGADADRSISPGRVAYERTRYESNAYRQRSPTRPSRTSSHRTGESEYKTSRRPSRSHRETRGDSIFDEIKMHRRRDDSTRRSRSPSRRHRDNRTDKELSERLEGLNFREPRRYISKIDRIYELN